MRKPRTAAYVYLAVLSLLLAAGLAVEGARSAEVSADLTSRGVHAEATVVAVTQQIEDIEPSGGTRQWTDVTVSFIDAQGSRVRATREGSDSAKVGEKLRIVYDPQDPVPRITRDQQPRTLNPRVMLGRLGRDVAIRAGLLSRRSGWCR